MHTIVVLNDGETWTTANGCCICMITDEQLEDLMQGSDPSHIKPVAEVSLRTWFEVEER